MLSINYQTFSFAKVVNRANFYKEKQPEIPKLRSLVENIKLLFKIPATCVELEVAEGKRVYKIGLTIPGAKKVPIGYFVFLPLERRLDAYSADNPGTPLLQWKQRKLAYSRCGNFLDWARVDSLFSNLTNLL